MNGGMLVFLLVVLVIGFVSGWVARSIQFAADKDCANPEHNNKDHEDMTPGSDERTELGEPERKPHETIPNAPPP